MSRKVFAIIEVDDDRAIFENKGTGEYLEREFGWLEQSGIVLKHWLIADDDDDERWARYINYLIEWGSTTRMVCMPIRLLLVMMSGVITRI